MVENKTTTHRCRKSFDIGQWLLRSDPRKYQSFAIRRGVRGMDHRNRQKLDRLARAVVGAGFPCKDRSRLARRRQRGVAYNGCDGRRPLCNYISERIENRTRARQICYVFDSYHHASSADLLRLRFIPSRELNQCSNPRRYSWPFSDVRVKVNGMA